MQPAVGKARFDAVMRAAEQSGLLSEKSGRIGGRVSPALVKQAKRQTQGAVVRLTRFSG